MTMLKLAGANGIAYFLFSWWTTGMIDDPATAHRSTLYNSTNILNSHVEIMADLRT